MLLRYAIKTDPFLMLCLAGRSSDCAKLSNSSLKHDITAERDNLDDEELRCMIKKAEREATEARAEYMLRNKIIQNVVIAHPVLKAVHGGRDETFADRYVRCLAMA